MPIQVPGEINPTSINALPNTTNIDISTLFPNKLSKPITPEQIETNINRINNSYAAHGVVAKIANHVETGLELGAEREISLTQGLRALQSATAQLKDI
jgi:hypothetical protein